MTHVTWGMIIAGGKDQQLASEVGMAFLSIKDRPLLAYSILAFEDCPEIDGIVVVANKDRLESVQSMAQMFGCSKLRRIVAAGSTRKTSVQNGLKVMDEEVTIVSIHEASRPCVTQAIIGETVKAAKRYGTGIVGSRLTDPIKRGEKGQKVTDTLDGTKLWISQSPQTFKLELLTKAIAEADKKGILCEDEAQAVEMLGKEVHMVPSQVNNMRIEEASDLALAAVLL